jgi:hypothetical protein
MATGHLSSLEEQQSLYDKYDDEELSSARQMMGNLPMAGGVQTGPATILSLVHNPNSEENREYIANNKALLRAFPILKQLYGYEKHAGLDYDASNRLDQERDMAIDDFAKTFGKDNLPEMFRRGPAHQIRLDEVERNLQAKRKRGDEYQEQGRQKGGIVGYNKGGKAEKEKELTIEEMRKLREDEQLWRRTAADTAAQLGIPLEDYLKAIAPSASVVKGVSKNKRSKKAKQNDKKVEEFDQGTAHPEMFRKSDKLKDLEEFHEDDYAYMEQERPGGSYIPKKEPKPAYRPLMKPDYEYLDKQDGGQQRGGMVGYQEGGDVP